MIDLKKLPNWKPGEKTVLLLRRHWLVPAKILFALMFATIAPVIFFFVISGQTPDLLANEATRAALVLTASFYYLAIWMFLFQEIIDYYLDMWVVTTERVMSIEQHGLFTRTSSELHLANIVDASSEVRGILHTLLDYGHVHVQTAGEKARFHFKEVPHPERVREEILKLVDEDKMRHQREAMGTARVTQTKKQNTPS